MVSGVIFTCTSRKLILLLAPCSYVNLSTEFDSNESFSFVSWSMFLIIEKMSSIYLQ